MLVVGNATTFPEKVSTKVRRYLNVFDCGHVGEVELPVNSGERSSGLVSRKRGAVIPGVRDLTLDRFYKMPQ